MSRKRSFDGRSWSSEQLSYLFKEKIANAIAVKIMPILNCFIMSDRLNTLCWKLLGVEVGKGSKIRIGTRINAPSKLKIGRHCLIHGVIKSRGGVLIGNGVEFVEDVFVSTQSHNAQSKWFESVYLPIDIQDYAWIGPRSAILQGVVVCEGCVVGANAVVTSNTVAWGVYVGVPARMIKHREKLTLTDGEYETNI